MLFGVSVPPQILVIGVLGGINLLYAYCSLLGDVYWEVSVGSESFVRWTTPLKGCGLSIKISPGKHHPATSLTGIPSLTNVTGSTSLTYLNVSLLWPMNINRCMGT